MIVYLKFFLIEDIFGEIEDVIRLINFFGLILVVLKDCFLRNMIFVFV